jgi:hypothetical protein
VLAIALLLACPAASFAQMKVIISGGFNAALPRAAAGIRSEHPGDGHDDIWRIGRKRTEHHWRASSAAACPLT